MEGSNFERVPETEIIKESLDEQVSRQRAEIKALIEEAGGEEVLDQESKDILERIRKGEEVLATLKK